MESAFEFADICRSLDYHNFLFSMKASNPLVMVQAYRLLAEEMYGRGWDYPLHLGVTEVSVVLGERPCHALTKCNLHIMLYILSYHIYRWETARTTFMHSGKDLCRISTTDRQLQSQLDRWAVEGLLPAHVAS